MSKYNLYCIIADSWSLFPIDIEKTKTVGHLKETIRDENSVELGGCDPDTLILHKINIFAGESENENYIEEVKEACQRLGKQKLLNPLVKLSTVFAMEPPSDGYIHILVTKPQAGESRNSRASLSSLSSC